MEITNTGSAIVLNDFWSDIITKVQKDIISVVTFVTVNYGLYVIKNITIVDLHQQDFTKGEQVLYKYRNKLLSGIIYEVSFPQVQIFVKAGTIMFLTHCYDQDIIKKKENQMTTEHDKALVTKYPELFRDRHADMKTTAMCWGFECGDGWYWLLNQLCDAISSYAKSNMKGYNIVIDQVKEKYGGLRFYYHTEGEPETDNDKANYKADTIGGMVWFAEDLSYHICEECGSTTNVTQDIEGWVYTRCARCREKMSK